MPTRRYYLILAVIAIFILASMACVFSRSAAVQATKPVQSDMATLPPPLKNVSFPTQIATLPSNWPAELSYPSGFEVVDTSSGKVNEGQPTGWSAKLRYRGNPQEAADKLASFYQGKGWKVLEKTNLDSGGYLLVLKKGTSNGVAVFDPDPGQAEDTRVIVTIFQ